MRILQNLNEVLVEFDDSAEKKNLLKRFKLSKDLTYLYRVFYHDHYPDICEAVFLKFNYTPEVIDATLAPEDVLSIDKISTHDPLQYAVWNFIRSIFMAACAAAEIPVDAKKAPR